MGVPSGASTGAAQGRITIDVTQLAAAQAAVRNAAQQINAAMSQVSATTKQAQVSIGQLQSGLQQLGAAFGVTFGAAGIAQLARFVTEVDAIATAYRRQSVAAVSLAGSQERLNELMAVYQKVTGGVMDDATALTNLTNLMSVGFADSAEELERFATAIRGISSARGMSQDTVTQNLILELFTQRGARLDQLGLQYDKVKQRQEQFMASDRSLTQQAAYQQAVLDQAIQRYGKLATSAEGAATGMEILNREWKNSQKAIGEFISPVTTLIGLLGGTWLHQQIAMLEKWQLAIDNVSAAWRLLLQLMGQAPAAAAAPNAPGAATPTATAPRFNDEQKALITDWWKETQEIEKRANRERVDATRQYEQQRTDAIRQYEQTILRDAQDFALARARAEEDYGISLQRLHRDIAQREARQQQELERSLADTRAESEDRTAEMQEEFNRRRERAERDHRDSLSDAAGRLDAKAVAEAQRKFANRRKDEEEDFAARLRKERDNESKRIAQANEAYQRQLEDARAADAQRLEDLAADYTLRRTREDEDRGIRLERLKADHDAQLGEMARQHEERLIQIADHERESREKVDDAFQEELAALGIRTAAYKEKLKGYEDAAIEAFDRVWAHWLGRMQGPSQQFGGTPSIANPFGTPNTNPYAFPERGPTGEYMYPGRGGGSIDKVDIHIYPTPNQSAGDIGGAVRYHLEELLKEVGS